MLIHLQKILTAAVKKRQGLGAFNTFNLELSQAIIKASATSVLPLIIQVTPKSLEYAGAEAIFSLVKILADKDQPKSLVALHLDHGKDFTTIKECIDLGISSVHFDGSLLPFNKNIILTKKVVSYAKKHRVLVQGEVGAILGKEGLLKLKNKNKQNEFLTDPEKAREFVRKTGVSTLAVSVGSLHGLFKGREKLDFARIRAIKKLCPHTPLVLHGSSGVSAKELKRAVESGISIFNFDTVLRIIFTNSLKKNLLKNKFLIDPRVYFEPAKKELVKEIISYQQILKG